LFISLAVALMAAMVTAHAREIWLTPIDPV
jgi:hypothetical protein